MSSASNSKTSMDNSSGHPNDAGKKAAATARVPPRRRRRAASSSSDVSSSSDDSSDDSSNDREDPARSAQTIGRGKDLAFRTSNNNRPWENSSRQKVTPSVTYSQK